MTLSAAYAEILKLGVPVFQTADLVAHCNISTSHASKILRRLTNEGLLNSVARGTWALASVNDPFVIAEQLTAPLPAYISLLTALYHHGMISQIPRAVYLVSLAKSRSVDTPLGMFSIHHVTRAFFCGFETHQPYGIKIATPEKALIDLLYLRQSQPKRFRALPELEFPQSFSVASCQKFINKITSKRRRASVTRWFDELNVPRAKELL